MRDVPSLRLVVDNSSSTPIGMPRRAAKSKIGKWYLNGIPRRSQCWTVENDNPRSAPKARKPPNLAITSRLDMGERYSNLESAVNSKTEISRRPLPRSGASYDSDMEPDFAPPADQIKKARRKRARKLIAERVKDFRMAKGYPVAEDFAKLLDIPSKTWSHYERGRNQIPEEVIDQLVLLGASMEYIYAGKGTPGGGSTPTGRRRVRRSP